MTSTEKGFTNRYFPMSAVFIGDPIWEVLKEGSAKLSSFVHGYTYSGRLLGLPLRWQILKLLSEKT